MRRMNPHREGTLDLGAKLTLHFRGLRPLRHQPLEVWKDADRIDQTRNLVYRGDRTPPIRLPLGREREMQAEVRVWMRPGVDGDLSDPRRRHHDARRRQGALVEGVEACGVG